MIGYFVLWSKFFVPFCEKQSAEFTKLYATCPRGRFEETFFRRQILFFWLFSDFEWKFFRLLKITFLHIHLNVIQRFPSSIFRKITYLVQNLELLFKFFELMNFFSKFCLQFFHDLQNCILSVQKYILMKNVYFRKVIS